MATHDTDRETIDVYDTKAVEYTRLISGTRPDPQLTAFIARLTPGARVLDLGCGPAKASATMQAAGLLPDAVDASAAMVAAAKEHFGVAARQGDFHDLRGPYDAIWANFSLLHMPHAGLAGYLRTLAGEIRPNGLLHIALKTGNGEARDGLGRLYSYHQPDAVAAHLTAAGFVPEPPATGSERGLDGTMADWFAILATRSDPES
ncbi:MAG: class I SAM-dependent methyltransferase [Pseudomonadota bacterium]